MGKTEEDLNGLKLGFLKTVQPNSFFKVDSCCFQLQKCSGDIFFLSRISDFVIYM